MRKTEEKTIDGLTFLSKQLAAGDGFNVGHALGRIMAEGFRLLGQASSQSVTIDDGEPTESDGEKSALDVDQSAFFGMVAEMLGQLPPDKLLATAKRLLSCTKVKGGDGEWTPVADQFDDLFAGRYGTLLKVLVWLARFNFADVFSFTSIAKEAAATLGAKAASGSMQSSASGAGE